MGKHLHARHNLRKRCDCAWQAWPKCQHPWHFHMMWRGHEYRFQLNAAAAKPPDYVMLKTEAEG